MPDLSKHRMTGWEWYGEYRSRLGMEACLRYINSVYKLLAEMKPGGFFVIEKNVRAENIDLFIKTCCMFIQESRHSREKTPAIYEFNSGYTQIKRRQ